VDLLSAAIMATTAIANYGIGQYSDRTAAKEDAKSHARNYNESVRQQQEKYNLFDSTIGRTYGNDFISLLRDGGSTQELMQSIGPNTALGKQLALYGENANLAVSNARQSNTETGVMANMQGQQQLNELLAQRIAGTIASGQAASSQATSGIRSDRGTGNNAVEMQEQQNALAMRNFEQQVAMQNKSTILGMQGNQRSAAQQATQLRKQMDISATDAIEKALNAYDEHMVEMRDMDVTQKNLMQDAKDRNDDADGWWFFDQSTNLEFDEDTLNFIDD